MGNLIFCRMKAVQNPYYIEESAVNVYSFEELEYYIKNNAILLDASFMRPALCEWISGELKNPQLGEALMQCIGKEGSLYDFLKLIFAETAYYTAEETADLLTHVKGMQTKSEFERRKLRADLFAGKKQYRSAINEYRVILSGTNAAGTDAVTVGNVWHNMGCVYARMFLFEEALTCFAKAYSFNEKMESLREMLLAALCSGKEDLFKDLCKKYYIEEKSRLMLIAEYRRARDKAASLEEEGQDPAETLKTFKEDYKKLSLL